MIYPYECPQCTHQFEVIKCVADMELPEKCPKCDTISTRYIALTHFYGASDWDKSEYNPGMGIVTRNSKHRAREAKARGLVELGNEDLGKLQKENEKRFAEEGEKASKQNSEIFRHEIKKAMEAI